MVPAAAFAAALHRKRKAENQRDTSPTKRLMSAGLIRNHNDTAGDSTLTTRCSAWEQDTSTTTTTTVMGITTHDFRTSGCPSSLLGNPTSNDGARESGATVDYTGPAINFEQSRNTRMLAAMVDDACISLPGDVSGVIVHTTRTSGQPQRHDDYGQSQLPHEGRTLTDGDEDSDWGWFVHAEEDQQIHDNGGHNGARL